MENSLEHIHTDVKVERVSSTTTCLLMFFFSFCVRLVEGRKRRTDLHNRRSERRRADVERQVC